MFGAICDFLFWREISTTIQILDGSTKPFFGAKLVLPSQFGMVVQNHERKTRDELQKQNPETGRAMSEPEAQPLPGSSSGSSWSWTLSDRLEEYDETLSYHGEKPGTVQLTSPRPIPEFRVLCTDAEYVQAASVYSNTLMDIEETCMTPQVVTWRRTPFADTVSTCSLRQLCGTVDGRVFCVVQCLDLQMVTPTLYKLLLQDGMGCALWVYASATALNNRLERFYSMTLEDCLAQYSKKRLRDCDTNNQDRSFSFFFDLLQALFLCELPDAGLYWTKMCVDIETVEVFMSDGLKHTVPVLQNICNAGSILEKIAQRCFENNWTRTPMLEHKADIKIDGPLPRLISVDPWHIYCHNSVRVLQWKNSVCDEFFLLKEYRKVSLTSDYVVVLAESTILSDNVAKMGMCVEMLIVAHKFEFFLKSKRESGLFDGSRYPVVRIDAICTQMDAAKRVVGMQSRHDDYPFEAVWRLTHIDADVSFYVPIQTMLEGENSFTVVHPHMQLVSFEPAKPFPMLSLIQDLGEVAEKIAMMLSGPDLSKFARTSLTIFNFVSRNCWSVLTFSPSYELAGLRISGSQLFTDPLLKTRPMLMNVSRVGNQDTKIKFHLDVMRSGCKSPIDLSICSRVVEKFIVGRVNVALFDIDKLSVTISSKQCFYDIDNVLEAVVDIRASQCNLFETGLKFLEWLREMVKWKDFQRILLPMYMRVIPQSLHIASRLTPAMKNVMCDNLRFAVFRSSMPCMQSSQAQGMNLFAKSVQNSICGMTTQIKEELQETHKAPSELKRSMDTVSKILLRECSVSVLEQFVEKANFSTKPMSCKESEKELKMWQEYIPETQFKSGAGKIAALYAACPQTKSAKLADAWGQNITVHSDFSSEQFGVQTAFCIVKFVDHLATKNWGKMVHVPCVEALAWLSLTGSYADSAWDHYKENFNFSSGIVSMKIISAITTRIRIATARCLPLLDEIPVDTNDRFYEVAKKECLSIKNPGNFITLWEPQPDAISCVRVRLQLTGVLEHQIITYGSNILKSRVGIELAQYKRIDITHIDYKTLWMSDGESFIPIVVKKSEFEKMHTMCQFPNPDMKWSIIEMDLRIPDGCLANMLVEDGLSNLTMLERFSRCCYIMFEATNLRHVAFGNAFCVDVGEDVVTQEVLMSSNPNPVRGSLEFSYL